MRGIDLAEIGRRPLAVAATFLFVLQAATVSAGSDATIEPGAVEIGASGSMTTIEGITSGALQVRGGTFVALLGGLGSVEVGMGVSHVASADDTELGLALGWQRRLGDTPHYPYVSLGGGWRFEEVGSFSLSRYPVGGAVGLRSLLGRHAGFRIEYRFRRVLNDPIADVSEHQLTLGLSVFLHNPPGVERAGMP